MPRMQRNNRSEMARIFARNGFHREQLEDNKERYW